MSRDPLRFAERVFGWLAVAAAFITLVVVVAFTMWAVGH